MGVWVGADPSTRPPSWKAALRLKKGLDMILSILSEGVWGDRPGGARSQPGRPWRAVTGEWTQLCALPVHRREPFSLTT